MDTQTETVVATVDFQTTRSLSISADGSRVLATDFSDLSVYDGDTANLQYRLPIDGGTDVVPSPDGSWGYVAGRRPGVSF